MTKNEQFAFGGTAAVAAISLLLNFCQWSESGITKTKAEIESNYIKASLFDALGNSAKAELLMTQALIAAVQAQIQIEHLKKEVMIARIEAKILKRNPSAPAERIAQAIVKHADKNQVFYMLVAAQMSVESNFDTKATSKKGARGLMQLLPSTAKSLGLPTRDIEDIDRNVDVGVRYLRQHIDRYKAVRPALVRYVGGDPAYADVVLNRCREFANTNCETTPSYVLLP